MDDSPGDGRTKGVISVCEEAVRLGLAAEGYDPEQATHLRMRTGEDCESYGKRLRKALKMIETRGRVASFLHGIVSWILRFWRKLFGVRREDGSPRLGYRKIK